MRDTGLFRGAEVATAVELLDEALDGDDDYRFIGAFRNQELVGYACWGPTPGTEGTYDLYWIAVERSLQGRGMGSQLIDWVEQKLRSERGHSPATFLRCRMSIYGLRFINYWH